MSEIIDQPEQPKPKKTNIGLLILGLFISLFFIIRGSMYMGTRMQIWGIILILVGIIGLVFRIYELTKKR